MAGGGAADSGGKSDRWEKRDELEQAVKGNFTLQVYILMAVTVMGYLAFTWSTVVLMGGYVSSLQKTDFRCLTVMTVIEATLFFNNMESEGSLKLETLMRGELSSGTCVFHPIVSSICDLMRLSKRAVLHLPFVILAVPVYAMLATLISFYIIGPFVCIGLSLWRLRHRDYAAAASMNGEASSSSLANLTPALDFFYILVLCQGVLYCCLAHLIISERMTLLSLFHRQKVFPREWCAESVRAYIRNIGHKCARDPSLAGSFLSFAVELLESESQGNHLRAARLLDILIKDGEDVSSAILPSKPKVQKLIDTLNGSGGSGSTEIRVLAARIVTDLASGIQLADFPGAIRSVSSLLQPHCKYGLSSVNIEKRAGDQILKKVFNGLPKKVKEILRDPLLASGCEPTWLPIGDGGVQQNEVVDGSREDEGAGFNELIVQGLRILEGLACDPHNCRDICAAPGLLAKLTMPLYSATLIQDISSCEPWAQVANCSLRAVHRLILVAPGRSGRRLRREISSNKQVVSNLQIILQLAGNQQLKMPAIEILTQLVLLGSSANVTEETRGDLVSKQLEILLADEYQDEEQVPVPAINPIKKKKKTIKATAGESLSILSKSEPISRFIVKEHNDIVDRLTAGMINAKYNIRYRTLSAEILENICTHCKELVNETLLQKVIEILTKPKTEASETTMSAPGHNEEIHENSSQGDDVEKQSLPTQTGQGKKAYGKADKASDQKPNEDEAELQQALLSLTLVIHETLVPVLQESTASDAFVDKLKAIVDDNRDETTPVSLRIIKLCCQIVISRNRCTTSEQIKEFLESLSKVSKTMANLESCMLFAGTDFALQKTARPLLSDLKKELNKLVA